MRQPVVRAFLRAAALVLAANLVACAQRTSAPPEVPVVRAMHGVASLRLDAVLRADGTPAFAYGGAVGVAPTIRVSPGERIEIVLHNGMHAQRERSNDVNLHFHGLMVSPRAPSDDVLTMAAHPGQTIRYVVRVPPDHEPGLYWYHPHIHGQTFWQVAHGMSGVIVVEGLERHLPALAGMRERIVVLRQAPSGAKIDEPGTSLAGPEAQEDADGNPCRPEIALRPSIDGAAQARFDIRSGERQFFRVVNASASRYFDLSIDGVPLDLVALDGVALDAYPGARPVMRVKHVVIAPAGRAEFVVRGPSASATLRSQCFDSGPGGDAQPATILGQLAVTPVRSTAADAPLVAVPTLPRNALGTIPPPPAARRTIRLTEDANHFYINGKTFDMSALMGRPAVVARSGTVEEWNVVNDTDEGHDFHIHQVHFAEEALDGIPVAVRHWVDTINVPSRIHHWNGTTPQTVRLLVDFRNPVVRGRFLFHCHILDHEDRGMMALIEVR